MSMNKSVFGLDENVVSALSYALGPISGVAVYVMERENRTVRFHALQSTVFLGALWIASAVVKFLVGWIWLLGGLVSGVLTAVVIAATLFLALAALIGAKFRVPVVGEIVEQKIEGE